MPEAAARLRVTYAKTGDLRFTGHLDLQRLWERTLRRSALPIAYSQGFHPQARVQLACALPLGISSSCEVMDFWLESPLDPLDATKALCKAAPPGITIKQVDNVGLHDPPLQTRVVSSEFLAILDETISPDDLLVRVETLLASPTLIRTRRDKTYDLRPLIEALFIENPGEIPVHLHMRLSTRESATGRPEEVLAALGLDFPTSHLIRTNIIFK